MTSKSVIFDFNGTLFWDSEYQERSWIEYLERKKIKLSKEEINIYIHGRNAKDTFEYIFKRNFTKEEILNLVEEKEILYRNECLKHSMNLAPGAQIFIEYLLHNHIPIAIATASGKTNIEFFIDKFNLLKYFKLEHIIFNDGNIKGKPNPDLFLKAVDALNTTPNKITIFEDSLSGIEAAKRSKVKNIVLVNTTNIKIDNSIIAIKNFNDFDRTLL